MTSDASSAEQTLDQAFQQAVELHRAGRLPEAEQLYQAILQVQPAHAEANHNMGVLAVQANQPAAGLQYFMAALEANPAHGQYWLSYSDALLKAGQAPAAREVLGMAQRQGLQGEEVDALSAHIQAAMDTGKPRASAPGKTAPGQQEINALAALFSAGKHAEAERLAREMTEQYPRHGFGWKVLGALTKQMGRNEEALAFMQKAVELSPDDAHAHSNLGVGYHDFGRMKEAEASYRRALQLKPDLAEARNNLGMTLQETGRLDEAVASYRRALQLKPDYVEALSNLGVALQETGRLDEAEASHRRALQFSPDYAQAYCNLGLALKEMGRLDEAEVSCRQALRLDPAYAEAYCNLGIVLRDVGQLAEAEACCRQALELKPDHTEALVAMGNTMVDAGKFDEAEALFRRALAIKPEVPGALSAFVGIRKMTADDAGWLTAAERIVQRGLSPRQESELQYAMGKYCDDIKDFDRAFGHYRRANELKKSAAKPYDRQQMTNAIDLLMHSYSSGFFRGGNGASDSDRPLFIVGMPRSGTSLVEQIIASHPATFGAGELPFWNEVAREFGLNTDAVQNGLDDVPLKEIAEKCLRNLGRFPTDALRVVDKMPSNFFHLGLIHAVFPKARILHTCRNPIDTCLSIYFQDFNASHDYANDLDDLAHYYRAYHRLMAHWRAVLPPEAFLDVPYDALVEDQEGWSRKIIEFIGLGWDARCLDFYETERKVGTASNWQVRQKIYKSSKERWRNYESHVGPLRELLDLQA